MKNGVFIHSIGTAVPEKYLMQDELCSMVSASLPDDGRLLKFAGSLYSHSGILKRHSVISDMKNVPGFSPFIPSGKEAGEGPPTSYRNSLYSDNAPEIAGKAVENAFSSVPSFEPESVTHLITASCTGFYSPGIDLSLVKMFGLRRDISRINIGFMGCMAAIPALAAARAFCLSSPGARVLLLCAELCSIHYRHRFDEDTMLSNSLFADGAGAALLSADRGDGEGHGFELLSFASRLIGGTENDMAWIVGDHGFEMKLSRKVPSRIGENISSLLGAALEAGGLSKGSVTGWAIHPGGRAILDRCVKALGLRKEDMETSYSVLRDFGNMSSATILFVLQRILNSRIKGSLFAAAMGPGLSAEAGMMEVY